MKPNAKILKNADFTKVEDFKSKVWKTPINVLSVL